MGVNKKCKNFSYAAAILAVFAMSQSLGGLTPALSKISEAFPDISQGTVMYVSTIASLTAVPASVFFGNIAGRKIGYKTAALVCGALLLVFGCLPTFIPVFSVMLVSRAIFGIGLGGITVLGNPLVTLSYEGEKRAGILGVSTFVAFGGAMILQLMAGWLTDLHWSCSFLAHFLIIIPLLLIFLFLPSIRNAEDTKEHAPKGKMSVKAWAACLLFGISTLMIAPLLVGSSLIASRLTDSAAQMSLTSICYSAGCMLGGLIFGGLFKAAGRRCMTVIYVIGALGLFGASIASSIFFLDAAIFMAGLGFGALMSAVMMVLGLVSAADAVALATAVMMAATNIFTFLCSSWMNFIGYCTGDSLYMPIRIGALLYIVFAAVLLAKPLIPAVEPEK